MFINITLYFSLSSIDASNNRPSKTPPQSFINLGIAIYNAYIIVSHSLSRTCRGLKLGYARELGGVGPGAHSGTKQLLLGKGAL